MALATTVSSHFSLFSYFFISDFPYGHVREGEGKGKGIVGYLQNEPVLLSSFIN